MTHRKKKVSVSNFTVDRELIVNCYRPRTAFSAFHIVFYYNIQSSCWWQFTQGTNTCLTFFLAPHSLWMETVVMVHKPLCMSCHKQTHCLHDRSCACWGRVSRQKTFSLHSHASSQWPFCWWEIRTSDHACTCYVDTYHQVIE